MFVHEYTGANSKNLKYILTPEGRIVNSGTDISPVWSWEYNLTDQLGNVRVVLGDSTAVGYARVLQETHYYPFGMRMSQISTPLTTTGNDYLYNGKQYQDDFGLNWYDYGARFYDPALGRFTTVDPKAEKFFYESPYCYVGNNPIRRIDKDGKIWTDANGNELTEDQRKNAKVYIFYDKDFSKQTMKQYNRLTKKYGAGSVAISMTSTAKSFAKDWGDMNSKNINNVNLNVHGSNQQLHLDWRTNDYITSTGTGKTSSMGNPAINIKDLPQPTGDVSNAQLNINSCHSNDKNDSDMPLVGDKKTVAESFQENFNFKNVRSTAGAVNYDNSGEPQSQWYYFDFWQNSEDEK